jgi:hypothetical protein
MAFATGASAVLNDVFLTMAVAFLFSFVLIYG